MATHTIIHGTDLKRYALKVLKDEKFANRIDPHGVNVVYMSMLHNDVEIRALMLMKVVGSLEPQEATVDFPIETYQSITQTIITDDGTRAIH
jgi:hypothetical protein